MKNQAGPSFVRSCAKKSAGVVTLLAAWGGLAGAAPRPSEPFAPLMVYDGDWAVRATHPWSGAAAGAVDRLHSRCRRFTVYFACEQTINGKPASLIVYTATDTPMRLNTRTISPDGLAGGRGELTLAGAHWTYLDKPPASLKGDWSRTENFVLDHDHIRFEEYASSDEGRNWRPVNAGEEMRVRPR